MLRMSFANSHLASCVGELLYPLFLSDFFLQYYRMSFANSHLASCVGELHKSKDDTGDLSLTCQGGEVIKAHSFILSIGSVLQLISDASW